MSPLRSSGTRNGADKRDSFQKSGELATHDKRKTILARDFAWAREFTRGAGA